MAAYALHVGVKELGFFGVDMSSKDEYILQRPGGHYFITLAKQRGIKLNIPNESDLIQPPPLYGIFSSGPMGRKLAARAPRCRAASSRRRCRSTSSMAEHLPQRRAGRHRLLGEYLGWLRDSV